MWEKGERGVHETNNLFLCVGSDVRPGGEFDDATHTSRPSRGNRRDVLYNARTSTCAVDSFKFLFRRERPPPYSNTHTNTQETRSPQTKKNASSSISTSRPIVGSIASEPSRRALVSSSASRISPTRIRACFASRPLCASSRPEFGSDATRFRRYFSAGFGGSSMQSHEFSGRRFAPGY